MASVRPVMILDKDSCEVRIDGAWVPTSVTEAHARHRGAEKRCPACHGQVRTHGTYVAQQKVVMAHVRTHDGCPRITQRYTGTPTPHPNALP